MMNGTTASREEGSRNEIGKAGSLNEEMGTRVRSGRKGFGGLWKSETPKKHLDQKRYAWCAGFIQEGDKSQVGKGGSGARKYVKKRTWGRTPFGLFGRKVPGWRTPSEIAVIKIAFMGENWIALRKNHKKGLEKRGSGLCREPGDSRI